MAVFRVFNQDEVLFGAREHIEGVFADCGKGVELSSYQQRRHCYIFKVRSESDVVHANSQPHDGLHARFRTESPGRASAGGSKGGNGSARVTHHADARYINAVSKPGGKRIYDSADVMNSIGHALGNARACAGRSKAVKAGN